MNKIKSILTKIKPLYFLLSKGKRMLKHIFLKAVNKLGYNTYPIHAYYSPLPILEDLKKNRDRWIRPSSLKGINYDLIEMKDRFGLLIDKYLSDYLKLPAYDELKNAGFGPGYTYVDSITSYVMLREIEPKIYFEIGSGLSTWYASLALKDNAGIEAKIICVDPYPYEKLKNLNNIRLYVDEVQNIDIPKFRILEANDVLFIDSSHTLKLDSDIAFLFLEVLPSLKKSVYVHIHDVPFPYNIPYPPEYWVFDVRMPRYWNEAMLAQAFLCYNDHFKILISTPLIRYYDEEFLRKKIPGYKGVNEEPNTFSSLWLKKVK